MSNQRTDIPRQAPLAQFQPHKAETYLFRLLITIADSLVHPIQFPNFIVPAGARVTLRPAGQGGQNAGAVYVADTPEKVQQFGGFQPSNNLWIFPGADVGLDYAVNNLNELWLSGAQNDGLVIIVSVPAVE